MCGVIIWRQQTTVRIAFQNIGGFLQEEEREIKLESLWQTVIECQINILGFTEPNTCWDLLPDAMWLAKYTHGWWETCQWSLMYNRTETNRTPYQPGCAGILCVNQVAHQMLWPGDDPSGLGCWCWTQIQDIQGFYLRIMTMYQPCNSNGPLMTYQQQVWWLTKLHWYACPWDAILVNITKEIQSWQELRDQVILLTNYNNDITSPLVQWWAANLGLVEAITWLHLDTAPPTYQWGSQPIDGILHHLNYWRELQAAFWALVMEYIVIIAWSG